MFSFLFEQIALYITLAIVFFLPGFFLIKSLFSHKNFSALEKLVLSVAASIVSVDFLIILIGKIKIPITAISVILAIALFCALCYLYAKYFKKEDGKEKESSVKSFSKKQTIAIISILFLTIFIKTTYLKDAILPTSTDLGHHMYWAKTISLTGQLPVYEKVEIQNDLTLGNPQPIADFIIGEHLIFSAVNLISGLDFVSYFPVLVLFSIHMSAILAIFIVTKEIFKENVNANNIAITSLLLMGPVYALASPQAKFVSGGVIGNTLGNLFIPVIIFLFIKALAENSKKIFALALFIALGMAYTHHLSTFVFIFIIIFFALFFAILNRKTIKKHALQWMKIILSPAPLTILAIGMVFLFFIYTPTYLNKTAIDTAVGAPTKATRIGLTFTQLKYTAGEARMALGIIGMLLLLLSKNRKSYQNSFLFGWSFALMIMSLKPNLLFIDIPSNRVASYIVFPFAITAAYALVTFVDLIKAKEKRLLPGSLLFISLFLLFTFIFTSGFYDNAQSLNLDSNPKSVLQTYRASEYLSAVSDKTEVVLKDHNYLSADSWIKVFFMRGYNYPFSRAYFKRYEDETKQREQCTNLMISAPSSTAAKACFNGTNTKYLMVNPKFDAVQFQKSGQFWQIYNSDDVSVFFKNK